MKKKILLSVLALFVFAVFVIGVNAQSSTMGINSSVTAKTPENVPAAGSTMHGTVTESFSLGTGKDFSKIVFDTAAGGTENGETNLKKIIVGKINLASVGDAPTKEGDAAKLNAAFTNWFTAYCLDGSLKYPDIAIHSNENYFNDFVAYQTAVGANNQADIATNAVKMLNDIVRAAVLNDPSAQSKITGVDNYLDSIMINYADGDFTLVDKEIATALADLKDSTKTLAQRQFKVNVNKITFYNFKTDPVSKKEITFTDYTLTVSPQNIVLDAYTVSDKTNTSKTSTENYTKALWIIEHTYPSLSLRDALAAANVDLDELKADIATLYELTDATDINTATENVVYGVIQYAIWSVTGTSSTGATYTGVHNNEKLDTFFKYLVDSNRVIPSDYATGMSFTNEIDVVTPPEGKELLKKTDTVYTYGPYSASYDALDGENMSVTVVTEDADGVKIVDADGNVVTEVEPFQEFFIQMPKKAKLGNVSVKLETNITKFVPDGLRGRIYQPVFTYGQNVMSGGSTETEKIDTQFDLVINAKTGVENVAVLLMVTLIAFSLGYLVITFKNKPVELNN